MADGGVTFQGDEHKLPHSVEAEQFLLGAILFEPSLVERVMNLIEPKHFFVPVHARLWEMIVAKLEIGDQVSPVTLAADLRREEWGGIDPNAYVTEIAQTTPSLAHVTDYARAVIREWQRRQIIEVAERIRAQAINGDESFNPDEALGLAMQDLSDSTVGISTRKPLLTLGEAAEEALRHIEAAKKAGREVAGLPTGFRKLDYCINGLCGGHLVILAARPGMGKSAMGMQIALQAASQGHTVDFYSNEMVARELALRAMAAETGVDGRLLSRGNVTPDQYDKVARWARGASKTPLLIDQTARSQFGRLMVSIRSRFRQRQTKLVVVDYLQLIRVQTGRNSNRNLDLGAVTGGLKELAQELEIPVLLLSQLSRDNVKNNRRPQLPDLRDSGSIEQDADEVIFLHAEDMEDPGPGREVIVAKNRAGTPGTVHMVFNGPSTSFTEVERQL